MHQDKILEASLNELRGLYDPKIVTLAQCIKVLCDNGTPEIRTLTQCIKALDDYGTLIKKEDNDEGQKAITLAKEMFILVLKFTRPGAKGPEQAKYRQEFSEKLKSGYNELATQRNYWFDLLRNIALAATVVGCFVKYYQTGTFFFSETKRQQKVLEISKSFSDHEAYIVGTKSEPII